MRESQKQNQKFRFSSTGAAHARPTAPHRLNPQPSSRVGATEACISLEYSVSTSCVRWWLRRAAGVWSTSAHFWTIYFKGYRLTNAYAQGRRIASIVTSTELPNAEIMPPPPHPTRRCRSEGRTLRSSPRMLARRVTLVLGIAASALAACLEKYQCIFHQ